MKIKLGQPLGFWEIGKRDTQQDSLYPLPQDLKEEDTLFIVCDGMGGHSGGEIASSTIVKGMHEYYDAFMNPQPSRERFLNLLERARTNLDSLYNEEQGQQQMGTTLTFLCFHENGYLAAHIGDSRIYHFRPGRITGLVYRSKDHTQTQEFIESGILSPIAALTYTGRNILDRAIMPRSRHEATIYESDDIEAGDYFMLCSDGVVENLTDEMLQFIFAAYRSPEECMELLKIHCKMSSDNHTCLIIPVKEVIIEAEEEHETTEVFEESKTMFVPPVVDVDSSINDGFIESTEERSTTRGDEKDNQKVESNDAMEFETTDDELLLQSTDGFQPDETLLRNIKKMKKNENEPESKAYNGEKNISQLDNEPYWYEDKEG